MGTIIDVYNLISSLMDEARKAKNDNMISQLIDNERSRYTRCPICHDNWLKSRNGR